MQSKTSRKPMVFITAAYFFYYMAYTASFSFIAVYLKSAGYRDSQVGLIYAFMAAVSFIAGPVLGYLADTKIPIKVLVLTFMGLSIPAGFVVKPAAGSFWWVCAAVLLLALFDQQLVTLMDSWTYISRGENEKIVYSVARGFGAFGCAVAGFFVGKLIGAYDASIIFWLHAGFMVLAFTAGCFFLNVPCKNSRGEAGGGHYGVFAAFKELCTNHKYMFLLIGLLLLNIGSRAVVGYLPMLISNLGGDAGHTGWAIFLTNVGVLPVMILYPKLAKKWKPAHILIVACVLVLLRCLSFAVAWNLQFAIYVQLLEAFAFGLFNPSLIDYTAQITPDQLRSSAITVSAAVQVAVCGFIGNLLGSAFLEYLSLKWMFYTYAGVGAVGVVLVIFSVRSKKGENPVAKQGGQS